MKQSCTIKKQSDFSEYDLSCLFLLYYPLIGMEAVILYGVLRSLQGNVAVEQIRIMTDLSDNRLTHARKQLEQYQLLETYYHPQEESWIYELKAPLSSYEFLRHDSFSRLFLQKVGSGRFDRIKAMLDQGEMIPSGYQNISEMINVSSLREWDQQKESAYEKVRPSLQESLQVSSFDFDTFLKGMENIFPARLRTEENLARIAQLASIHGISAREMKRYVMRSINPNTQVFDMEKLKEMVYKNQSAPVQPAGRYDMPPVKFLQQAQKGAPVGSADKKLVESLCRNYGLNHEVVNVLIEYTLQQTNQKFPKAYVEKIASSWVRLQIRDVDAALAQTKKQEESSSQTGSWYDDRQTQQADEELIRQAQQMQKKRKGD